MDADLRELLFGQTKKFKTKVYKPEALESEKKEIKLSEKDVQMVTYYNTFIQKHKRQWNPEEYRNERLEKAKKSLNKKQKKERELSLYESLTGRSEAQERQQKKLEKVIPTDSLGIKWGMIC